MKKNPSPNHPSLPDLPKNGRIPLPPLGTWPGSVHLFQPEDWLAIKTAYGARRPLLVIGEPGLGKSQLARAAAAHLKRCFLPFVVAARSQANDLLYHFDAVARLAQAQVLGAQSGSVPDLKASLDERLFLRPGPLWRAFHMADASKHSQSSVDQTMQAQAQQQGCVVLIDEIDKADSDLPNGLLETLGNGGFSIPLIEHQVCQDPQQPIPLVVITSNRERELPNAFMRRCVVLKLQLPEEETPFLQELERKGEAHFGERVDKDTRAEAAQQLWHDRERLGSDDAAKPGVAEYLDLLRALVHIEPQPEKQMALLKEIKKYVYEKQQWQH